MELHTLLDQVTDRDSFLVFVEALIEDQRNALKESEKERQLYPDTYIYGAPGGWQNWTIESFLGGALGWAQDTRMGQTQGLPDAPSWKTFAVFLYCGKIYE